jgi:hypothetical protein
VEIAKVMRRFPWMVEVVRRNPMSVLHPYMVNAYVAKDGSEVCLRLVSRTFCARGGEVRETRALRGKAERGIPPQRPLRIHRGGEGIHRDTLSTIPNIFLPNPLTYRLKPCFPSPFQNRRLKPRIDALSTLNLYGDA